MADSPVEVRNACPRPLGSHSRLGTPWLACRRCCRLAARTTALTGACCQARSAITGLSCLTPSGPRGRTSGGVGAGRCRAPSASRSAARAAAPAGVWNGNSAAAGGKKRARPGSRAQCRSAKQNVVSISRGKRSLKYLRARGRAEPRGSSGATSHPRPAHCLGAAVSWLMNLPRGRQRSVRRSAPGRQAARARGEGFGVRVRGRTAGSRPAAAPGGPAVARAARASGCAYCG